MQKKSETATPPYCQHLWLTLTMLHLLALSLNRLETISMYKNMRYYLKFCPYMDLLPLPLWLVKSHQLSM